MAESKLGNLLSKTTFEDVLDPRPAEPTKTPDKKDDIKVPDKPDDAVPLNTPKTDTEPTNDSEESFYESLAKIMGYEVEGEFDESVEGIAEYAKAVGQRIAEEEVKDLFESFPDVKEYLQFRLNNGDPAKYFESKYGEVDYSTFNVTEQDVTTQETVVRKYLKSEGYNEEEVTETIKDYKETGLLFKQAKRIADRLTEAQKEQKEELIYRQAELAREQEAQKQAMIAEISQTIEKGSLHNLIIPEKDRKEFRAWLLQPNHKGQTKRQETMNGLSLAQKLELEFLAFKGFNLEDLVRKQVTQNKINFLKKNLDSKGSRLAGGQTKVPSDNKLGNIKISDIL